ncbi:MAG: biotin--[acetyl-CoA-carboxylase] ligase [Fluviicola sp.]
MEEIGRSIIRLESVDSTNNYTANRARENDLRHGAVILAVEQTRGKGQLGAYWQSDAGANLTFSVFLNNVNLSVQRQFVLTKIVSLSLTDTLASFGIQAKIKWPNDIYVGDRKIAGVLIENVIQGKTITRTIVGIGLNVNQRDFGKLSATSISSEKEQHFALDDVLFSFISNFNARIKSMSQPSLDQDYHNLLYWLDEKRQFEDSEGVFEGVIKGISELGMLVVESELRDTSAGSEQRPQPSQYHLKEIKFVN